MTQSIDFGSTAAELLKQITLIFHPNTKKKIKLKVDATDEKNDFVHHRVENLMNIIQFDNCKTLAFISSFLFHTYQEKSFADIFRSKSEMCVKI
jgi:hypothetical protein